MDEETRPGILYARTTFEMGTTTQKRFCYSEYYHPSPNVREGTHLEAASIELLVKDLRTQIPSKMQVHFQNLRDDNSTTWGGVPKVVADRPLTSGELDVLYRNLSAA